MGVNQFNTFKFRLDRHTIFSNTRHSIQYFTFPRMERHFSRILDIGSFQYSHMWHKIISLSNSVIFGMYPTQQAREHKPTLQARELKTARVMKFRLPFMSQRALISSILSDFGLIDTQFS